MFVLIEIEDNTQPESSAADTTDRGPVVVNDSVVMLAERPELPPRTLLRRKSVLFHFIRLTASCVSSAH